MDVGKRSLRRLGKRIQELRKQVGFSQEAFALETGIARSYLSGVERGKKNVSFQTVAKIASYLGVSISELSQGV